MLPPTGLRILLGWSVRDSSSCRSVTQSAGITSKETVLLRLVFLSMCLGKASMKPSPEVEFQRVRAGWMGEGEAQVLVELFDEKLVEFLPAQTKSPSNKTESPSNQTESPPTHGDNCTERARSIFDSWSPRNAKIVGGSIAPYGQYPWQVINISSFDQEKMRIFAESV